MSAIDIWAAAETGNLVEVLAYLAARGDPNARDSTYYTPLHHAARGGHREVIDALLRRGARVSAQTQTGETPLHCACAQQRVFCALQLLAARADPATRDFRGLTPVDYLRRSGDASASGGADSGGDSGGASDDGGGGEGGGGGSGDDGGGGADDGAGGVGSGDGGGGGGGGGGAEGQAEGGGDGERTHLLWLLTQVPPESIPAHALRALRTADALAVPPPPPPDASTQADDGAAAGTGNGAAAGASAALAAAARGEVMRLLVVTAELEARAAQAEQARAEAVALAAAAAADAAAARAHAQGLAEALREREGQVAALTRRVEVAEQALQRAGAHARSAAVEPRVFTARDLADACSGFGTAQLVGRGATGAVYRGTLQGVEVAVKQLQGADGSGGLQALRREVSVLMMCRHESLLPLLGLCLQEPLSLVYPYMANGSLDAHLGDADKRARLGWRARAAAAHGVASALHYLHTPWGSKPAICHRDVKPANILLDETMSVRLGDAGIASIMDNSRGGATATQLQGTLNYLDPAYLRTGTLTEKSDVYSLGVVVLELVMGGVAGPGMVNRVRGSLIGGASCALADGSVEWPEGAVEALCGLAHGCCSEDPAKRPELPSVLTALETLLGGSPVASDAQPPRQCKICLSAPPNTRFRPCLHSVACEQDASLLLERRSHCPLCREPILDIEMGIFSHTYTPA